MYLVQQNNLNLKERAKMLKSARSFFDCRNILEVDVPILNERASVDAHIDLLKTKSNSKDLFLHSSPEYGMKKLISKGIGDIYQISHVFRDNELSDKHLAEFTMVEWYRVGMPFEDLIEETIEFASLFLGSHHVEYYTYGEAFLKFASIDYLDKDDDFLNITLGTIVEPSLPKDKFCIIYNYPKAQAALAKVEGTPPVARRFELYFNGIELANGYDELNDSEEMLRRFKKENEKRISLNKDPLPIDYELVECLKTLPDCCGVAVGFDRLIMLRKNFIRTKKNKEKKDENTRFSTTAHKAKQYQSRGAR